MTKKPSIISLDSFMPVIEAADGLTLSQVCAVSGLESSTIQNWVKRGFVPSPIGKKYTERHIARILLISSLRDCMRIESIGELMEIINGDTDDESDDIISEQELYSLFSQIALKLESAFYSPEQVPHLVEMVMLSYKSDNNEHKHRLYSSLVVMALAYIAGIYKREADCMLADIKKDF